MQSLQEIQIQNKGKVQFTFYDGKNNIAVQDQTLDSLLKSNIDLFILNLADNKESVVKDFILKVKERNCPVIVMEAFPVEISSLSKYYEKVSFVGPADTKKAGIEEGQIIVDEWKSNKNKIDKNSDNILQYVLLEGEVGNPVAEERTRLSVSTINDAGINLANNKNPIEDTDYKAVNGLIEIPLSYEKYVRKEGA